MKPVAAPSRARAWAVLCGAALLLVLGSASSRAAPPAAAGPGTPSPVEPHPAAAAPVPRGPAAYQVELVVFRIAASQAAPQDWAAAAALAPPAPAAGDDTTTADEDANGRFVRTLAAGELQLNDVAARLRSSGAYPVVAHAGWIQNAFPWGRGQSMSLQQLGLDVPGLSGTVTLQRGQYLHLGLALDLAVAQPPAGLAAPPDTTFTLHDDQRVKLNERHYFDSPAFGVIALVTPAQRADRQP